jgi:Flp pilus assembly protein TadD
MHPGALRPAPAPVRIGLVGPSQIAWKDIATGLRACELAFRSGLDLQLVRVTNTEPHADERALPFPVQWHERVEPARMGDIYRSLDLFLGTSRGGEEGFFLPAVEAMACGVPCVLTDIPCFRGYGAGQYALFVPPRDPAAMAEAIVLGARMPALRAELRAAGLEVSSRYRRETHGAALEQALLAIAAPARPAAHGHANVEVEAVRALRQAADKLSARGDWQRALRFAEAATVLLPEDPVALRELMKARFLAGDDAGALHLCDLLLELDAADADLHAHRARLLYAAGRHAEAARSFAAAIGAGRDDAELHNDLGVVQFRCGDLTAARQSFHRALTLRPDHADARANLQELGEPRRAS